MRCEICRRLSQAPMCRACGESYDRYAHDESSVMGAIIWAARRAHRHSGRLQDREVVIVQRLRDFIGNELGAVDYGPTIRFFNAARAMFARWLTADARARGDEPGGVRPGKGD